MSREERKVLALCCCWSEVRGDGGNKRIRETGRKNDGGTYIIMYKEEELFYYYDCYYYIRVRAGRNT